jgi:3',5'-cyclic AMP phosphodiesterase CpdA
MLIAQISDTHILAESSHRPEAGPRAEDLRRCIADINCLDPAPDLVIHTGDTVQTGAPADYAHLRKLLAPLRMPVYLAPGNRDDRANFRAAFEPAAADGIFLQYTVEEFPVRLVALDSIDPAHNQGVYCADRQRWLDACLSAAPGRPTILFIHHPPFDVGQHYIDGYRDPADRAALAAIVARHRQVRRLLCGHCHRSSQRIWADTQATTMPSVARDLREGIDAQRLAGTPLYQLHALSDDGEVATQTRLVLD